VIVPGDVNSTLAAALTAVKLGFPLAHLESGLRSFDLTMPEEVNRIVADRFRLATLPATATRPSRTCRAEGIPEERMHFVGNTMIDTPGGARRALRAAGAAARLGVEPGAFVLVTLHRPALVDVPAGRDRAAAGGAASKMPVLFPSTRRTRK